MMVVGEEHKQLHQLLDSKQYGKAHEWLNRMHEVQLEGEGARLCLTAALHASASLFLRVLKRCPPGEYSGKLEVRPKPDVRAYVSGTVLTLAAALNRPEHVKLLLAEGYDPNGAGVASAAAFDERYFQISNGMAPYGERCAVGGNNVSFAGRQNWTIWNLTPLAAAVACGSREAAAVLLRCPAVWKAESGVVCRAAVSALQMFRDDPRGELAGMVFRKAGEKALCPDELVRICDLQIKYASDFCTYDLLETQIRHGFCDADGARIILKTIEAHVLYSRSAIRARMQKMTLLAKAFPHVCRESWVTGLFLRELVRRYDKGKPHQRLLRQWRALCGGEGDLTWARVELYRMSRANRQTMLKELGQETRLVMDADSLSAFGKEAKWELMDILSCVALRHNTGLDGISALTENLLRIGDLRCLRRAAKEGAFAGEDPNTLLAYLEQTNQNNLRPLVLAYGGRADKSAVPRWKQEHRRQYWRRRWDISGEAYLEWLTVLTRENLPEEECLRRLQVMHYGLPMADLWQQDCVIPVNLPGRSRGRRVTVAEAQAAVICGEQTKPLELMLRYMPETLEQRYRVRFWEQALLDLEGSPLTIAAATGRTGQVRLLLNAGFAPDETGRGLISSLQWFRQDLIPVTPVMAAIYYGEEETARMLLEAGAVCDFSKPLFQKLLLWGDAQTLALAKKLPNVGFESLPQQWLENLKERDIL